MPDAPSPITSPPRVPGQPYSAADSGAGDPQSTAGTVYNASGGSQSSEPWPKIRDGGAINMTTGESKPGSWPDDGASDGSVWKQT